MIRQELAITLARAGCVRRWDPQIQVVYDDRRVLAYAYVEERLRRHDRSLFLRFNALAERWELFKWHGLAAPTAKQRRTIPAEEVARRSMFLWTVQDREGGFCEPDARVIRQIQTGDLFARFGSSSAKRIADALDEEDRFHEAREKAEIREAVAPDAQRLAFEARKLTGHHKVFSHSRR